MKQIANQFKRLTDLFKQSVFFFFYVKQIKIAYLLKHSHFQICFIYIGKSQTDLCKCKNFFASDLCKHKKARVYVENTSKEHTWKHTLSSVMAELNGIVYSVCYLLQTGL